MEILLKKKCVQGIYDAHLFLYCKGNERTEQEAKKQQNESIQINNKKVTEKLKKYRLKAQVSLALGYLNTTYKRIFIVQEYFTLQIPRS